MHPILFEINKFNLFGLHLGPIKLYTYGVMMAIGFLVAFFYLTKACARYGISKIDAMDYMIVLVAGGILGARLNYVIIYHKYFIANPFKIFALNEGGLVYYGGVILDFILTIVFCKIKGIDIMNLLDVVTPGVPLGHIFGRIGCFFNGCCYGRPTHSSIGCVFPNLGDGISRLPTQLFESFFNLILFLVLFKLALKIRIKGIIFSLYLILYSIFRYINETLRGDFVERGGNYFMHFTFSETVSIFALILGIISLIVSIKRNQPIPEVAIKKQN